MAEVDRLQAELKETMQLLELARQQLRLTTSIIRDLQRQNPHRPTNPSIKRKREESEVSVQQSYTKTQNSITANFVEDNYEAILTDLTKRLKVPGAHYHWWGRYRSEEEDAKFQTLFEE